MMRKRGESEVPGYMVFLVLAIIGFVIVLFLFLRFGIEEYSSDEVCKLSVLGRATVNEASSVAGQYVPLKCTTKKICITDNFFGKCGEFAGEEDVQRVKLSGKGVSEKADEISRISAQAMFDCWSQMGEGKIGIVSKGASESLGFDVSKLSCVICSRVAIDSSIDKKDLILSEVNVAEYARRNKIPGSDKSYLEAFTGVQTAGYKFDESLWEKDGENLLKGIVGIVGNDNVEKELIGGDGDEMAIVFTQIKPDGYDEVIGRLLGVGAAVGGTTFFTPGLGKIVGGVVQAGGLYSLGLLTIGAGGVALYTYSNVRAGQVAAAGYCGSLQSGNKENREGCSGVQIVPYSASSINSICNAIDGSP